MWTGKASAVIVLDRIADEFADDGLFEKVEGKRNVANVGFTTDGDVFSGFYSVPVREQIQEFYESNIFAFSFESHERCMTPKRFVVVEILKEKASWSSRRTTDTVCLVWSVW